MKDPFELVREHVLFLIGQGYSSRLAWQACKRALGTAEKLANRLPQDMRERALLCFLAYELSQTSNWIDKRLEAGLRSRQMAENYAKGLAKAGLKPGPQTVSKYRKAVSLQLERR